jgi:peptide/nickel transport system substrate-binding protein
VLLAVGGNYDATLFRYFAAPDPDVLWHFFDSATIRPVGQISLNFTHLADQQIDDALAAGRASADPAVRKPAYATVQRRFAELVPYIWLYRVDWVIASSSKVHNAQNVTLPDGQPALPFIAGTHRITETWIESSN